MKNSILIFFGLFILFGCNNSSNHVSSDITKVRELVSVSPQSFVIKSDRDTTLIGKNGTRISIPQRAFCFSDGTFAEGEIKIELKEFYSISQMQLSGLHTISSGENIETGGMIYINATSKERELGLITGKSIALEFKSPYNSNMEIFYGDGSLEKMNWVPENKDTTLSNVALADTIPYSEGNHLHNTLRAINLGWINCDRFLNFPETTEIFVKTIDGIDSSIFCGLVLKKYNSIVSGSLTKERTMCFSPIPLNEEATIMLISYRDENYYFGYKDIKVKSKETYEITMQVITKEELKNKLEEFDKQRPII